MMNTKESHMKSFVSIWAQWGRPTLGEIQSFIKREMKIYEKCGKISCSSNTPKLEHEKMHIQQTLNVSLKINGEKVWCCKQFKMVS